MFNADMSGLYNFTIEQGVTFQKAVTWKDENSAAIVMTGMTVRSEIRTRDCDLSAVLADDAAGLSTGVITLSLTDLETKALEFDTAAYDMEISQGGLVIKRLPKGVVTLDHEVTEDLPIV